MIELIVSNAHRLARYKNVSKKFFLGDWCFDDLDSLKKVNKDQLIKNDWNDHKIRQKDYKKLSKKIDIYIKILSKYLNNLHKTKYSKKYWKLLLYVWLGYYLPYQYIRFKLLKKTIENNNLFINIYNNPIQNLTLDTIGFYNKSSSCEEYNYSSFIRIIFFLKSKGYKIRIIKNKKKLRLKKNNNLDNNLKFKNSKYSIINIFDKLFYFITKKNPILLMGGFRIKDFILLSLRLKQVPLGGYQIFNWYEIRNKFKLITKEKNLTLKNKNKNNLFNDYICENIIQDLPQIYTIYYKRINFLINKIKLTPKVIFSSFKHYHDEIFKFWLANKIENKIKFFSICHGGHHQIISPVFDYDYLISKRYIQWFNQYKNKKLKLPISFFINFKKNKKKNNSSILYMGYELNKFPSGIIPGPLGASDLIDSKPNVINFYNLLDKDLKKNFIYSPKRSNDERFLKHLKKEIGNQKIAPTRSFNSLRLDSKIVICSYPQTGFLESMMCGPTILLCDLYKWKFDPKFKKVYDLLIKNKIIFFSEEKAADYLNKNINEIEKNWWSNQNQLVINKFFKKFYMPSKEPISKWVNFIENEKKF